MLVRGSLTAVFAATILVAPTLAAQGASRETKEVAIPESALPPEGMCRVWLKDVPERQQPAPTDCATALRTRPRGANVLWGDLSKEAKQPPKRLQPVTGETNRSLFDDPFGRRSAFQSIDTRGQTGTMSPVQALQAAEAANRATAAAAVAATSAAAVKAEQTKAAVVKRPDTP